MRVCVLCFQRQASNCLLLRPPMFEHALLTTRTRKLHSAYFARGSRCGPGTTGERIKGARRLATAAASSWQRPPM